MLVDFLLKSNYPCVYVGESEGGRALRLVGGVEEAAEGEAEGEVAEGDEQEEPGVLLAVEDAHHVHQDAQRQEQEHLLRAHVDVRVAALVQLQRAHHADDVHEAASGRVAMRGRIAMSGRMAMRKGMRGRLV